MVRRAPSSERRAGASLALAGLLLGALTGPAAAQQPARTADSTAADSLAARLQRAEEAIEALQRQLTEGGGAATRSGVRIEFTGRVLVSAFRNERRVNNVDDPQFVRPDSASALAPSSLGLTARQTVLGIGVRDDAVLGGSFTGDLDVDFAGGQQPSSGGRTFPLVRLRTARGILRWRRAELLAGQETPLVAGLNPMTVSAVSTPLFATAGNLWLWLPQVRASFDAAPRDGGTLRIGAQIAVLSNITGDAVGLFDTDADFAERSARPALQGRVRARWGDSPQEGGEIGCGPHVGWLASASGAVRRTSAVACDARVRYGSRVELRGEGYAGQGLRGLGGGGIGQNTGRDGTPLQDAGGWGQLTVRLASALSAGAGCGVDQPRERDVAPGGRLRNVTCATHAMVRPVGPIFAGLELRRLETRYAAATVRNHFIALSSGFEF